MEWTYLIYGALLGAGQFVEGSICRLFGVVRDLHLDKARSLFRDLLVMDKTKASNFFVGNDAQLGCRDEPGVPADREDNRTLCWIGKSRVELRVLVGIDEIDLCNSGSTARLELHTRLDERCIRIADAVEAIGKHATKAGRALLHI